MGGGDMNKILKKRIEEAAINGSKHYNPNISTYSQGKQVGYIRGFNDGAEYALSHQWIRVEEALPEEEEWVVVMYSNGLMEIRKGIYVRVNKPICKDIKIVYWMSIPKLKNK